ncbi:isopentenyl-diphosphate Delta-isomerase [Nocardiopsis mangrovi]|uniref:Isopentenyl-diphosphate Delta-isomerase n=1 Tax=Nocardiopsis mangrovi TaxID=1179818 RepID=A0ABV9E5W6_9ACTN
MPDRKILVELVDADGTAIGAAEKLAAHRPPGALHRAFSVFLFSPEGRMLLQRRADGKYHWPGVWSNSCCGHPFPAEPPFLAAVRRTVDELGAAPELLAGAGTVTYDLADPRSGLVEKEHNHLFVGTLRAPLRPDPEEVGASRWVTPGELAAQRASDPFSAWFGTVLEAAGPGIRSLLPGAGW